MLQCSVPFLNRWISPPATPCASGCSEARPRLQWSFVGTLCAGGSNRAPPAAAMERGRGCNGARPGLLWSFVGTGHAGGFNGVPPRMQWSAVGAPVLRGRRHSAHYAAAPRLPPNALPRRLQVVRPPAPPRRLRGGGSRALGLAAAARRPRARQSQGTLAKIRYDLCPRHMKDKQFWTIYFLLARTYILPFNYRHRNRQWCCPSIPGTWCHLCDPEAEASEGKSLHA